MFNKRKSIPTKEEVNTAYRNLNRVIKAISEDKDIPEWKKIPLIDKLLDRKREIQKWLFDYLDDEDFENKV
jgi:predicted RNA-binding protein associated with RNAse of E/G family